MLINIGDTTIESTQVEYVSNIVYGRHRFDLEYTFEVGFKSGRTILFGQSSWADNIDEFRKLDRKKLKSEVQALRDELMSKLA